MQDPPIVEKDKEGSKRPPQERNASQHPPGLLSCQKPPKGSVHAHPKTVLCSAGTKRFRALLAVTLLSYRAARVHSTWRLERSPIYCSMQLSNVEFTVECSLAASGLP